VSVRGHAVATVKRVSTTNTVLYLHRDHEESIVEVTSSSGALLESLSYDSRGGRRNASTWAHLPDPFGGTHQVQLGYTGHEHLDQVGLDPASTQARYALREDSNASSERLTKCERGRGADRGQVARRGMFSSIGGAKMS
jgi:hypothetical protein